MGLGNLGIVNMPTTGGTRNTTEALSELHLPDMVLQAGRMHQVTMLQDVAHEEAVHQDAVYQVIVLPDAARGEEVGVPQDAVQWDAVQWDAVLLGDALLVFVNSDTLIVHER